MSTGSPDGLSTTVCTGRVDKLCRPMCTPAGVARIAILVRSLAARACPADIAVGQPHIALGTIGLLYVPPGDGIVVHGSLVEQFTELSVFFGMCGIIVVKLDIESCKVPDVLGVDTLDEFLGLDSVGSGANHNGCAVCIVGAEIEAPVTAGLLEPDPDVCL